MPPQANDGELNRERQMLEEELLPILEEELDGYSVRVATDEYKEEFQLVINGEKEIGEYALPTILSPEFGMIFPEYFVVKQEEDRMGYAAAIEPHTKYIQVKDAEIEDALREFAGEWKELTEIREYKPGIADVSKVSFAHNTSGEAFAERV